MAHLEGKVVLVTGAGRGVGRVVAQGFARRGAIVAANDITPVNLDGTIADIQAEGGRARDYIYDVAKSMPVRALVNQVVVDWGRIDVLVNCARVEPHAPVLGMDEWDWQRTLDVKSQRSVLHHAGSWGRDASPGWWGDGEHRHRARI